MEESRGIIGYLLLAAFILCLHAAPSFALYSYPFQIFTTNGDYNDSPAVDVSMQVYGDKNTIAFKFFNNSTINNSLTAVYFHDGSLLGISSVQNSAGVSFSTPAVPGNLPGGALLNPPFVATEEFSASGDPPPSHEGIDNSGEYVIVTFDLITGGTLESVINELNSSDLRVGVRLQGFDDDSSESAIHTPEPTTLVLFGLGALPVLRRKRF